MSFSLLVLLYISAVHGAINLSNTQNCHAARARYLNDVPVTLTSNYDPWVYRQTVAPTSVWHGELCHGSSAHYPTESTSNCDEARAFYSQTYASYLGGMDPFQHWLKNAPSSYTFTWRSDLCSTSGLNPFNLVCNCSTARANYLLRYSTAGQDPWANYVASTTGRTWDCRSCNDTCSGQFGNNWAYVSPPPSVANVVIPKGCFLPLSSNAALSQNLTINGVLRCNSANLMLSAGCISVYGAFECGSQASPYSGSFTVQLVGSKPLVNPTPSILGGDKGLVAFSGGVIDLHGSVLTSWTRLSKTANPGDLTISLLNAVDWLVGDSIMITTTFGYYNDHGAPVDPQVDPMLTNEVRTITSISADHTVITINQALAYKHLSKVVSYDSGKGLSGTILKQAEVSLLTRRIKIMGDAQSDKDLYGGHVMIMNGARGYASGVEFYRMGQQGILARYPWHWHVVRDAPGQYISNSSVHYSYQRCVTIHFTNYVSVLSNACFNFSGHGYFLEDGVEVGNVLDGNLGVLGRAITIPQNVLTFGEGSGFNEDWNTGNAVAVHGPGVFWIPNPNNTVTNNVAAVSPGLAFWHQPLIFNVASYSAYSCPYAKAPEVQCPWPSMPFEAPFGKFANNLAHSIMEGHSACVGPTSGIGPFKYGATKTSNYENLTIWGVTIAVWPCGEHQVYKNLVILEAQLGMQSPYWANFTNVVMIAYDDVPIQKSTVQGIRLYDSGWEMHNTLFKNYDAIGQGFFAVANGVDFRTSTRMSGVVWQNSPNKFYDQQSYINTNLDSSWSYAVLDLDGSLTLTGKQATFIPSHYMMADKRCVTIPNTSYGLACPTRFQEVRIMLQATDPNFDFYWNSFTNITRYNFNDPTEPPVWFTITKSLARNNYRFSGMVNSPHVYSIKVVDSKISYVSQMSMVYGEDAGYSMALELTNVGDVHKNDTASLWWLAPDCSSVYKSALQGYFWDKTAQKLCVRLVNSFDNYDDGVWRSYSDGNFIVTGGRGNTILQMFGYQSVQLGYTLSGSVYPLVTIPASTGFTQTYPYASPVVCASYSWERYAVSLQCPYPQLIGSVPFASYGTPTGSCGSFATGSCAAQNSVSFTQAQCVGKTNCSFLVGNDAFGDPCSGTQKYLNVQLQCVDRVCVHVPEWWPAGLYCPRAGQTMRSIDFASFGQPVGSCGNYSINPACHLPSSLSYIQALCLNKASCVFSVDYISLGDPCPGSGKSFMAQATCA